MKLALISFDGLDPRVIFNNKDDLPAFSQLIDESITGKWKTPGHTIPSYIATLTGRSYPETNFYWDTADGGFARHRQVERKYLWEVIDNSITLLNIPVLYPPENINDCMVCGMLTPDSVSDTNIALPPDAQEMLNDIGYIHEVRADKTFEELGAANMFKLLCTSMDKRVEAAELLIDEYDSDLFYGVWTAPDRWFHRHHVNDVDYYKMYEKADSILRDILTILPDEIPKIFFSDHGFSHFPDDEPATMGHMTDGWYAIRKNNLPSYRDDSANILDVFPTVVNYFNDETPKFTKGRVLFHSDEDNQHIKDRLDDLGYLE